jgi:hypothetical protein
VILDDGGSPSFGGGRSKATAGSASRARVSGEERRRLEKLLDHDDPAVRQWATAMLDSGAVDAATKSATDAADSEYRGYVEKLALRHPDPGVRGRAELVLDQLVRVPAGSPTGAARGERMRRPA